MPKAIGYRLGRLIIIAAMQQHTHLTQLIHQRQIVQPYPPPLTPERPLPPHPSSNRIFFEEMIFEEMERRSVVEDYMPRQELPYFLSDPRIE
jgi:hypothetical protein